MWWTAWTRSRLGHHRAALILPGERRLMRKAILVAVPELPGQGNSGQKTSSRTRCGKGHRVCPRDGRASPEETARPEEASIKTADSHCGPQEGCEPVVNFAERHRKSPSAASPLFRRPKRRERTRRIRLIIPQVVRHLCCGGPICAVGRASYREETGAGSRHPAREPGPSTERG